MDKCPHAAIDWTTLDDRGQWTSVPITTVDNGQVSPCCCRLDNTGRPWTMDNCPHAAVDWMTVDKCPHAAIDWMTLTNGQVSPCCYRLDNTDQWASLFCE